MKLRKCLSFLKRKYRDFKTVKYFKNKNRNDELLVVFICQCEHIWDKTRDVVLEMLKRNIKVILYVVKDEQSSYDKKTIFEEFDESLVVKHEDKALIDLKPDYVFYARPYDNLLPSELRSNNVVKYSKTCYIPYGYSTFDIAIVNMNYDFIRNLCFLFSDNDCAYDFFCKNKKNNIKKGYQKAYNFGYPYLEKIDSYYDKTINNGLFKLNEALKVIWTPRWTNDEKIGGSNFSRYYKDIFSYIVNNNEFSFVFRPHPYLFDNFVSQKLITVEEKDEIINSIDNSSNSVYDKDKCYLQTFYEADVLVTDVSSIILDFFIFGKPIIFCHNSSDSLLIDEFKELSKSFYDAYSFDDIKNHLANLEKGIDPKKEIREKISTEFKNKFIGSSKRIVDVIENDWRK